jgi:hypothetical protein
MPISLTEVPMEFDLDFWHREPASRWLVKRADEQVHAGTILAFNDAGVVIRTDAGAIRLQPREVDWIRPLIEVEVDGWTVMAGFQAEDTTFDTWWRSSEFLVRINYSAPSGFSDLLHVVSQHDLSTIRAPSSAALARVRSQIHRILIERRGQSVPSIAHLQ